MNKLIFSALMLIVTLSGIPDRIKAQEEDTPNRSEQLSVALESIQILKDGYLLVRLTSDRRKIEELKRQAIASPSDKKIAARLERVIQERKDFNEKFRDAFAEQYTFSKVLYFYDYDAKRLLEGQRKGIFLNEQFEFDPSISIESEDFLVLTEGSAGDAKISAYIVHDSNLNPLSKPFPYYFRRNDFFKVFFGVFDSKSTRYRNHTKVAKAVQESFTDFYKKATKNEM